MIEGHIIQSAVGVQLTTPVTRSVVMVGSCQKLDVEVDGMIPNTTSAVLVCFDERPRIPTPVEGGLFITNTSNFAGLALINRRCWESLTCC